MKIALINTIEPQAGSGDGMTEYTYQLYTRLSKDNEVTLVAPLKKSKRNDVKGLFYTFFMFKPKLKKLLNKDFDVVHITNQEMGFVAKMLKDSGSKAKVVTTVHDLMRLEKGGFNKGMLQNFYNNIVSASVRDGITYSDKLIFSASSVERDSLKTFKLGNNWKTTLLGPKEQFRTTPIPQTPRTDPFNVLFMGALSFRKNVIFVLNTALKFKDDPTYKFIIYGSGSERENLEKFKADNKLNYVSFMGFANEQDLMNIYDSANVFFYPTLEEGSSLPILDAQARGLPVIIFKGNNLDPEVTKYCFVAQDEQEAANLLTKFKKDGYDQKQKDEATNYARSFSWDRVTEETKEVYKS